MIIRHPKSPRNGEKCYDLAIATDFAPTILEYAGVKPTEEMEGISHIPLLLGDKSYKPNKYVHTHRGYHPSSILGPAFRFVRSVTDGRYFYMFYPMSYREDAKENSTYAPAFALFDLDKDPHSMNNLIGKPEYKAIEEELRNEMEKYMISNNDFLPLPSYY